MSDPRSYLFVPGDRPDRFSKAASSGADVVIFDWEDAVGPSRKDVARQEVVRWFQQGGTGVVRINGTDTPFFDADLAAILSCEGAVIMVPKATMSSWKTIGSLLPRSPLLMLVETVEGLLDINAIACAKGVSRLAFGNLDFGADARIPGTGAILDPARFQIVIASRHGNLAPPIDGVTPAIDDEHALTNEVRHARALGFTAKLCIHPKQVAAVNSGFMPTQEELEWATAVIGALEESRGGVVQLNGKMIDKPLIDHARRILDTCQRFAEG